jgi:hypothetical protein
VSIRRYLGTERKLGRVAEGADVDTIAPTLIGAAHLLFAKPEGGQPPRSDVGKAVSTVGEPLGRARSSRVPFGDGGVGHVTE